MLLYKPIELEKPHGAVSDPLCYTSQGVSETESLPSLLVKRGYLKDSDHGVAPLTDTGWQLQSGQGMSGLQT